MRKLLVRLIVEGADQRNGGHWYMVTLTAPGDPKHSKFIPGVKGKHGACDCGQHGLRPGEWNPQESRYWNRFMTSIRREFGDEDRFIAYVSSVEVQAKRKDPMLHRHALLWSPTAIPASRAQELALRAGYGCSLQWQKPYSARSAGDYVAKYITKSSGQREAVPWEVSTVNFATGEVSTADRRATYRTWSKSNRWGITVQGLRELMARQARARALYLQELGDLLAEDAASAAASTPDRTSIDSPDPPPH